MINRKECMGSYILTAVCSLLLSGVASTALAAPEHAVSARATPAKYNNNNVVARFAIGGAALGSDISDNLSSVGFGVSGSLGYQLPIGPRWSVTPELWFTYAGWGGEHEFGASYFALAAGATGDYFFKDNVSGWAALRLGGGSVSAKPGDVSEGGFALSLAGGTTYFINEYVGVGAFFGVTRAFAGKTDGNVEMAVTAIDFGLQLRGAYAM